MGPRPYSENSTLPESSNTEPLPPITTQILAETSALSTPSEASTSSPDPEEIIPVEHEIGDVIVQDDDQGDSTMFFYPSPGDIMPYDHSLPDFIRQITNQTNLANLQSLKLRVISACISLHRMSSYLPNLRELDLEGSILNSLRDIGCSFKNLRVLKVGRCQLETLDGTFGLSSLRELYAERNLINDVSPCSNLPHIKHIDVSWNRIRNISYAGFLSVCTKLKSITFTGNPATEVTDYRKYLHTILPQIEILDGVPFTNDIEKDEDSRPFAENFEAESSGEIPDLYSISPSNSLNNLMDFEKNIDFSEIKSTKTLNSFNHDNFESLECDVQVPSLRPNKNIEIQKDLKNLNLSKNQVEFLERPKATNLIEEKKFDLKQKYTSIQKLDKDINYRSKKSIFFQQSIRDGDVISLPEIPNSSDGSLLKPSINSLQTTKNHFTLKSESNSEPVKSKDVREASRLVLIEKNITKSGDDSSTGAIKKKNISFATPISSHSTNSAQIVPEKTNIINRSGISSLTSGSPIRGNLTAALRNRNKSENKNLLKFALGNIVDQESIFY